MMLTLQFALRVFYYFLRYRMMDASKLASFINFKSVISNFKYLGVCPEDLYFKHPIHICFKVFRYYVPINQARKASLLSFRYRIF